MNPGADEQALRCGKGGGVKVKGGGAVRGEGWRGCARAHCMTRVRERAHENAWAGRRRARDTAHGPHATSVANGVTRDCKTPVSLTARSSSTRTRSSASCRSESVPRRMHPHCSCSALSQCGRRKPQWRMQCWSRCCLFNGSAVKRPVRGSSCTPDNRHRAMNGKGSMDGASGWPTMGMSDCGLAPTCTSPSFIISAPLNRGSRPPDGSPAVTLGPPTA